MTLGPDHRLGKRPRAVCPRCGKNVAASPINSRMREHLPPGETRAWAKCSGSGYSPGDAKAHMRKDAGG